MIVNRSRSFRLIVNVSIWGAVATATPPRKGHFYRVTKRTFSPSRDIQQGLTHLATAARELAQQNATELVERFGALGQRRFHLDIQKEAA